MTEARTRIAVVGTGYLGRLHARVLTEMPEVEHLGFFEPRDEVAAEIESSLRIRRWRSLEELAGAVDCAVVATTTDAHAATATTLMERGVDVMIEKPITSTLEEGRRLVALAKEKDRILQVGHVERYNPAIVAAVPFVGVPRYIEADRLGVFTGRSLDIDVLLDLMIHDLQLVISFLGEDVSAVHAVGIPVLTKNVDMANVRIEFASGAVANLTASRVSSDRVRKFRIFGHDAYVSVDTKEQQVHGYRLGVDANGAPAIVPLEVTVEKKEPLRAELEGFVAAVRARRRPLVAGEDGLAALALATTVAKEIDASLARWNGSR